MSIPTRSELIERARVEFGDWSKCAAEVHAWSADFALAEIRRAVADELEALRRTLSASLWNQEEKATALRGIDRRLSALREQAEHEQPPGKARPS